MMRAAALLLALLFCAGSMRAAEGGVGSSGATFLRINPMARSQAMGNAYTGLAQGIESLHFNPAGITTVGKWDLGLAQILFPLNTTYSYLAVARRIHPRTVAALHLTYLGTEDEERNSLGQVTGHFSNYDVAAAGTLGYQLTPEFSLGGTVRFIRSQLGGFSAGALGIDAGLKYAPLYWEGVTLGASIQNLGNGLEYIATSSPQPLQLRVGAAWEPPGKSYILSGELMVDREAQARAGFGGEYRITKEFFLRGGLDLNYDATFTRALKLGMGFQSRVGAFDYAFERLDDLGVTHRISYSYRGGQPIATGGRDTGTFFSGAGEALRQDVRVAIPAFINLSPSQQYDWLTDGFREIFASRLSKQSGFLITEEREARYVLEGRYSALGADAFWVGVRVLDARSGAVLAFKEGTIPQDDLIRATTTLAGAVSSAIPGR